VPFPPNHRGFLAPSGPAFPPVAATKSFAPLFTSLRDPSGKTFLCSFLCPHHLSLQGSPPPLLWGFFFTGKTPPPQCAMSSLFFFSPAFQGDCATPVFAIFIRRNEIFSETPRLTLQYTFHPRIFRWDPPLGFSLALRAVGRFCFFFAAVKTSYQASSFWGLAPKSCLSVTITRVTFHSCPPPTPPL